MKQNRSRCQLLGEINEVSFAVNDLHLYLDTPFGFLIVGL